MDAAIVEKARGSLVGLKWPGWYCDGVQWDGFSESLRVVLNNGNGAWREVEFDEKEWADCGGGS